MSSPSNTPDRWEPIRALIRAKLVELSLPSLAVAVAQEGEVLWEEAFGWADRENRIPATAHTLYSLASISKPITATGLMTLAERGALALDRPVNDYLGNAQVRAWVGDAAQATVRRVANHSSGLPLHYHFFYEDEPHRRPPMDETILRYANLVTPPGEHYQYCNLGYGLLDYAISRLSGKSYPDFMRAEVCLPLGLTHMCVGLTPELAPHQAVRYATDGLPIPMYDFDHPGGSAVYASAHDLLRFGMFHLKEHLPDQKPILTAASIDAMQVPTIVTDPGAGYGIGWRIKEDEYGYRSVSHRGGMGGVSTTLMLVPTERIAVVALGNAASPLPDQAVQAILSELLPEFGRRRAAEEAAKAAQPVPQEQPPFSAPAELDGSWRGSVHTYQGDRPFKLWFKPCGDVISQVDDQLRCLVNEVSFKEGYVTGRTMGDLGTDDVGKYPYAVHLSLRLRGQVLNGALTAVGLPGRRMRNALSHWVELTRE